MVDSTLTEENHVSSILLFPRVVIHHKLKLIEYVLLHYLLFCNLKNITAKTIQF